jgi:hypothetical protein
MGVVVAAETILQLIMGFSAMAAAASRDIVSDSGRVALMTLHAGYFSFMGAAVGRNVSRWLSVALDTVIIAEFSGQTEGRECQYHAGADC